MLNLRNPSYLDVPGLPNLDLSNFEHIIGVLVKDSDNVIKTTGKEGLEICALQSLIACDIFLLTQKFLILCFH